MTVSVVAKPPAPVMPLDVVRAVTTAAHSRGAQVFVHPTTHEGVRIAVEGGADVLAHTAPQGGPFTKDDVARIRDAKVALTPTLKLWRYELHDDPEVLARFELAARSQVRDLSAAGVPLFFGTDVGYMTDHDPTEEYELLAKAGLTFDQVLAMLTTAPAARLGGKTLRGQVAVGDDADLVVLNGDPRRDPKAWAQVRYAVRKGVVVHGDANDAK